MTATNHDHDVHNHDDQRHNLVKFVQHCIYNCSEETEGKLRSRVSLHRVPAQSVELKIDHERTLQRILTHFIFTANVRRAEQQAPGTTMLSDDTLVSSW